MASMVVEFFTSEIVGFTRSMSGVMSRTVTCVETAAAVSLGLTDGTSCLTLLKLKRLTGCHLVIVAWVDFWGLESDLSIRGDASRRQPGSVLLKPVVCQGKN
jgi:hypothetical protein